MARKVFLSVLGTGFYEKCTYYANDFSIDTRFIQQATLAMLTRQIEWTKDDAVYILLTDKARTDNWEVASDKRLSRKEGKEVEYQGLQKVLNSMALPMPICPLGIKDGKNETEMWDVFSTIYDVLQEGDELYFDVTHGFRYLPMLVVVLGNYAKLMKGINVRSITYGNFEGKDDKGAPIMDLQTLSLLQDWTSSAATFLETGRVKAFASDISLLQREQVLTRRLKNNIDSFNKNLIAFEEQISTCRGKEIVKGEAAEEVCDSAKAIVQANALTHPVLEVLKLIQNSTDAYHAESFDNLRKAIEWCKHYDLVQQGYTLCQESIITFLCNKFPQINPYIDKGKDGDKTYRNYWSAILGLNSNQVTDETQWKGALAEHRQLTRSLFNLSWVQEFRKEYNLLQQNRNQLNHAGFVGAVSAKDIKKQFHELVDNCMQLFDCELEKPVVATCDKKLFINLSNHPYSQWSEAQLKAAEQYGELIELSFPQIDPTISGKEIGDIVRDYTSQILDYAKTSVVTVHVMGEMCFVYQLVKQLQSLGIRCVCSTSFRMVRDEGDGKRYVEFQFNRFRSYGTDDK